jgi:UDP-4-amino-4-deoxy-L-arabinose-oxoglutarate aminotransferase
MHFRYVVSVAGGVEKVAAQFAEHGVAVRKGVDELMHRLAGLPDAQFPVAVRHFETSVSLPIYPALTEPEITTCVEAARAVLGGESETFKRSQINARSH